MTDKEVNEGAVEDNFGEEVLDQLKQSRGYTKACFDDTCKRIEESNAKAAETMKGMVIPISEKISGFDGRFNEFDKRFETLEPQVRELGTKFGEGTTKALSDLSERMGALEKKGFIPESAYYKCPDCKVPLPLDADACPACKVAVDWEGNLAPIVERNRVAKKKMFFDDDDADDEDEDEDEE